MTALNARGFPSLAALIPVHLGTDSCGVCAIVSATALAVDTPGMIQSGVPFDSQQKHEHAPGSALSGAD